MNSRVFVLGLAATLLAVLQTAGWLALGSFFVRNVAAVVVSVPTAFLIGSALTGFTLALFCAAGRIELGIAVCAGASALALAVRRGWVLARVRELSALYTGACAGRRWLWAIVVATMLLFWLLAIVPPRDADVMRYHLAHIRQIVEDGVWVAIPDYCYALPFGWSFNYLPFEYLGIPQGAHLLNWTLWLIAVACLLDIALRLAGRWRAAAWLLCAAFVYQPFLLKGATTAYADMYVTFEILAVTAWLLRAPLTAPEYALFGFAAWIGMQSRYQAAAIGLATAAALLVFLRRWRVSTRDLLAFAVGAGCALLLSSPFYVVNWLAFDNPVWPLFTGLFHAEPSYADQIADHFNSLFTGHLDVPTLLGGLRTLLVSPMNFPVPHLAAGLLLAVLWRRSAATSAIACFVAVYLAVWALTNPTLYGRYIVMLMPPLVAGWCATLALVPDPPVWFRRFANAGLGAAGLGLVAVGGIYSWDSLVYLASGDTRRYHDFTWFYDVYDWANHNTAEDARFLVVVDSGTSYYLDRPYRRADPCGSAVIDWPEVRTGEDLMERLERGGYRYLLYHEQDWSKCLAGQQMSEVIHAARESGLLETLESFDVQLGTSRFLRRRETSRALVLAPRAAAAADR